MPPKESTDILAGLELDVQEKQKVKKLEQERLQLEDENTKVISQYEKTVSDILEGKQDAKIEDLSKLDSGIERGRKFKREVSDLAENLTKELQDLGQFLGDMSTYKGFVEKGLVYVGLGRWADQKRLSRVRDTDVKQNLQSILDYGHHMVKGLNDTIINNVECYGKLEMTIRNSSEKLKQFEPVYAKWRADKESIEREMTALQDKLDKATEKEYAQLEPMKTDLQKKLDSAKLNENHYFTIVDKAKHALPVQRTHQKAYHDMINSLTILKTGLEQDIEHVTQVYLSAPVAIKTALGTKAASQYDKGMKYATDIATDTVLQSAKGVLDEVASRAERPLIEPAKLEAYRALQQSMKAEFEKRIETVKKQYAVPSKN